MTGASRDLGGAARRGVRWTAVNAVAGAGLQLLQISVLARLLPPQDFGRMAMILVILGVGATFAEFGLSSAIVQRMEVRRSELATLYTFNVALGGALFAALWVCAPMIESLVDLGEMTGLIRGSAFIFLLTPWGLQFRALLQKRLEFGTLTMVSLSALSVGTVVAVSLAMANFGVWALLLGHLTTEAVAAAILLAIGLRRRLWSGFAWDLGGARGYLVFGGFRLAAMIANAINARADQAVIGPMLGAATLGTYNVAQRLAVEPVQRINPVVTRVAFPVFSLAQNDHERLLRGYLRMTGLLLAINAPLLLGLVATAHLLVPVILGPNWDGAVILIRLLAVYALLRSIANAGGALIMAKGRADWSFYWNLALLLVIPASVGLAAWWMGSVAAVAGALIALQAAFLVLHYFLLLRRLIGKCGVGYLASIARPILTAMLMMAVVWQCDGLLAEMLPLPRLVALVAVGGLSYFGLSAIFQRTLLKELANLCGMRRWVHGQASAD